MSLPGGIPQLGRDGTGFSCDSPGPGLLHVSLTASSPAYPEPPKCFPSSINDRIERGPQWNGSGWEKPAELGYLPKQRLGNNVGAALLSGSFVAPVRFAFIALPGFKGTGFSRRLPTALQLLGRKIRT